MTDNLPTLPEALSAFLNARAADGEEFTAEDATRATTYHNVKYSLPVLATIGAVPCLLVEPRDRSRRRPVLTYRVNPAWAELMSGAPSGALAFDRAAALNDARALLGGGEG